MANADSEIRPADRGRGGLLDHPAWVRWGAHVAFWLIYFATRTAAATAEPPPAMSEFPYLTNRIAVVATYAALTGILFAFVAGVGANRASWPRNLALVIGAIALAPLTQLSEQMWPIWIGDLQQERAPFVSYFFQFGWALPLWGLTQALLGYHFESLAQQRAVARAQALAYDAQLRMLHYQINPHFLFNTLNAISTLVLEGRNQQAESMLMKLAGFLRYSLDRQPTEMAALSAEIDAQRKYLAIEQTRFEDKLKVSFNIEPGLEDARLPSLILQPILENAIKYAITPRIDGGSIDVSAFREGGVLKIRIEDDGPGLPPVETGPRRRGVGLANARERLELIYGERAGLVARNRDPNGCCVDIWLPLEEERVGRTLRLLLADDEPLALRRIKLALQDIPDVEIVGSASDGAQAINYMRDLKPDVVLLDIKMPMADGFEVANAVEDSGGPAVIFVSAFESYALRAFETSAVDYLVKPVEFERLASALGRARERRAAKDAGRRAEELAAVLDALKRESDEREGPRYEKEFWIRDRGRFLRVPVADVERIEAERDYVRLYWEGRTLLHRETMSHLEEKLDPNVMLRVHRSAFVNWKRLTAVRRDANGRLMAVLDSGDEVAVSRAYAQRVMSEMKSRA